MSRWQVHVGLFIANLIYAGNYTLAKEVMPEYIQPFGFILIRVVCATILYWLISPFFTREKVAKSDLRWLALCALFGVALNQLTFFAGLSVTTPINASIMMVTTPILVLLIANIMAKEKLTGIKVIGISLGCIGALILILFGKSFSFGSSTMLGDFLVFVNAASYGLYLVLAKPLMIKYHPLTIVKWIFLFGSIYTIPFGYHQFMEIQWDTFNNDTWISLGYVVIGTTFIAYLLNNIALKYANASMVGGYIYLQPLLASLIAIILGKDQITIVKVFCATLIFIGVYLLGKNHKKEKVSSQIK